MQWKKINIDDVKYFKTEIISDRKYNKLSDLEKKNYEKYDANKVEHGDILNALGGGLLSEASLDSNSDDKNDDDFKED